MKTLNLKRYAGLALVGLACASGAYAEEMSGRTGGLARVDTNGDGKVSFDEHAAGATKMFQLMDADKDGKVTPAEMDAMHERRVERREGKPDQPRLTGEQRIRIVDANGDGVVSAEEHSQVARTMFERIDGDKDGYVTEEERKAAHGKMMQRKSEAPATR